MAQVKKLFLIDAFALIYRSYFAFSKNPRINSKGLETSAVLGFVNSLVEVIKKEKPNAILPTMGGQTALNLAISAEKAGLLEKYKIELIGAKSKAIENAEEAVKKSDLICTTTSSSEPILEGKWLQPGTHVNLIGAAIPTSAEVDELVVKNSRFVFHRIQRSFYLLT